MKGKQPLENRPVPNGTLAAKARSQSAIGKKEEKIENGTNGKYLYEAKYDV